MWMVYMHVFYGDGVGIIGGGGGGWMTWDVKEKEKEKEKYKEIAYMCVVSRSRKCRMET